MRQHQRPAPAAGVRGVDGHQRRADRDQRQRQGQGHHGQGQAVSAENLHGQHVQADQEQTAADDGRQTDGEHQVAGVRHRPGPGQVAAGADQVGDQRALAVVAPVEMARPVPVMGLVGGQVERTVIGQVEDVAQGGARGSAGRPAGDRARRAEAANPGAAQRHQHETASFPDGTAR